MSGESFHCSQSRTIFLQLSLFARRLKLSLSCMLRWHLSIAPLSFVVIFDFFISHIQDFCHVLRGRILTSQYILKWMFFPSFFQVITEDLGILKKVIISHYCGA